MLLYNYIHRLYTAIHLHTWVTLYLAPLYGCEMDLMTLAPSTNRIVMIFLD